VGRGKKLGNKMRRGWNLLAGGWQYNWIATLQSGLPLDLPGSVDALRSPSLEGRTKNFWFNTCVANVAGTAAFMPDPAHGSFSVPCNTPAWQLRGPFTLRGTPFRTGEVRVPTEPQWDMSVNKKFYLNERIHAQFRFEMFNAFNTPVRPGPIIDPTDPNFGWVPIGQVNIPRQVQLGFKVNF